MNAAHDKQIPYENSLRDEGELLDWFFNLPPEMTNAINRIFYKLGDRNQQTISRQTFQELWDKYSSVGGTVISKKGFLKAIKEITE